jgi:hypothetical protein
MFLRQLCALTRKNFTLKFRNLSSTCVEFLLPLACGILAGLVCFQPALDGLNILQYFHNVSEFYIIVLVIVTFSFAASCTFILN